MPEIWMLKAKLVKFLQNFASTCEILRGRGFVVNSIQTFNSTGRKLTPIVMTSRYRTYTVLYDIAKKYILVGMVWSFHFDSFYKSHF